MGWAGRILIGTAVAIPVGILVYFASRLVGVDHVSANIIGVLVAVFAGQTSDWIMEKRKAKAGQ